MKRFLSFKRKIKTQVDFDHILTDASNVSAFDQSRLEGRIEMPIAKRAIFGVGLALSVVMAWYMYSIFSLQILYGSEFRDISQNNSLNQGLLIAERGVVYDRNGLRLVWNTFDDSGRHDFPIRAYSQFEGVGQLLGYVSYPQKDSKGLYWRTEYVGRTGIERNLNEKLSGINGRHIREVDAVGTIVGEHVIDKSVPGNPITLSVDAELSQAMFDIIATSSRKAGFRSGAGAIMDVHTGEILAIASYPSYSPQVMSDGSPADLIRRWESDEKFPFLNRVVGGVYTPGSVVKPFVAYAALVENIVRPDHVIVSTGEIVIPNPFTPSQPSRFTDWRPHGAMDLREAIAFSSNVYMYYISGGFGDLRGLGIQRMYNYFSLFGLNEKTNINLDNEQSGTVPNPEWKERVFNEPWRLGDTYLTSIGQFGFQSTPIQILRAYALLANGNKLVTPTYIKGAQSDYSLVDLDSSALRVVQEGMRMAVNYDGGTARPLERSDVAIAAKSGTAEVGAGNRYVNSWVAGYFPYEAPQYAFVIMMDRAPRENTLGATRVMGDVVQWMSEHTPEYLGIEIEDVE